MINIDVRGKIEVIVTGINVILNLEIGEIKRSESNDIIKHGFVQLCWRLAVIGYALDILFPNIKCTLVGNLFSPRTDKKFTPEYTFLYKNERRVETKKWTKAFE
ncbi:hypothetical protein RirG_101040 [Rhizophagus irregularis DAOM 197198w]|uniref:Uncharacterized protein n=1 Tax=Rhizophagus irregularis (strain DAOM 197198w) TaxID=1432141 RepID=A0A015JNT8_RHIIW|nr:hypothetical protein RirG_101040 [Rhizophagus irregularis DAOM 197198w]